MLHLFALIRYRCLNIMKICKNKNILWKYMLYDLSNENYFFKHSLNFSVAALCSCTFEKICKKKTGSWANILYNAALIRAWNPHTHHHLSFSFVHVFRTLLVEVKKSSMRINWTHFKKRCWSINYSCHHINSCNDFFLILEG